MITAPKPPGLNGSQAKRLALFGPAAAGLLAFVSLVRADKATAETIGRLIAGVTITAVILAVLAEIVPAISGGMSLLILLTAAFYLGGDAWKGVGGVLSNPLGAIGNVAGVAGSRNTPASSNDRYERSQSGYGGRSTPVETPSGSPVGGSGGGGGGGGSW